MMRHVLGSRASIGGVLGSGRGSAFTPLSLSPLLWLDAAQITGLSDGAAITTWTDMSGNGRDATQTGTATLKPTYKTGILNGKPVIRFDGGDWMVLPNDTIRNVPGVTAFVIVSFANTTARQIAFNGISSLSFMFSMEANRVDVSAGNAGKYNIGGRRVVADGYRQLNAGVVVANQHAVLCKRADYTGANMRMYVNGTLSAEDASYQTPGNFVDATTTWTVGYSSTAFSYLSGDIAELIIYDSALSDANRQAVEAYLGTKYGITVT